MIIAIDGPSGTGKSSVARELAKRLGFAYLDSGATYRAFTLQVLRDEVDLDNSARLSEALKAFAVRVEGESWFLDGEEVTQQLRSTEVTALVSRVSAEREVRERLVALQRELAAVGNVVVEGRDIGTVVFPHADFKFFLTASPEERARRRYRELVEKGGAGGVSELEVLEGQNRRDLGDSTRCVSPLRPALDAVQIDTTALSLQEVVERLYGAVRRGCDACF